MRFSQQHAPRLICDGRQSACDRGTARRLGGGKRRSVHLGGLGEQLCLNISRTLEILENWEKERGFEPIGGVLQAQSGTMQICNRLDHGQPQTMARSAAI